MGRAVAPGTPAIGGGPAREAWSAWRPLWAQAEARLREASKPHKIVKLISTAPAIGPIRAAQIGASVVTPHRFRTKRQFWSYCGSGIVTRSSADWMRDRRDKWVRGAEAPVADAAAKEVSRTIADQCAQRPRRLLCAASVAV